jgi:hypothetical protein
MRFMATVTIWLPDAAIAASIFSFEANFPVPVNRREVKILSAIFKGFMV